MRAAIRPHNVHPGTLKWQISRQQIALGVSESFAEQAAMLRDGKTTSRALTEAALERAHATQPTLNAFKLILDDEALAAADDGRSADRRTARSTSLLGVPTAVKDDMDLAGHPTAFGCPGDFPPIAEDGAIASVAAS